MINARGLSKDYVRWVKSVHDGLVMQNKDPYPNEFKHVNIVKFLEGDKNE